MARRRQTAASKAAQADAEARVERLMGMIEGLDGVDMALARDMIEEYSRAVTMAHELGSSITREGIMVQMEVGTVNNRHMETVENPAFATWCKTTQRMADLATRTSRFVKQGGDGAKEDDQLDAFVARR